jgi:hypothetical protein
LHDFEGIALGRKTVGRVVFSVINGGMKAKGKCGGSEKSAGARHHVKVPFITIPGGSWT